MPAANPLVTYGEDSHTTTATASPQTHKTQQAQPGGGGSMNPFDAVGSASDFNAAGTSENVGLHVAALVIAALVFVYILRASGFKFVVAVGG